MEGLKYQECKHNINGLIDGCLLFDPSDDDILICDCCNCHRSFHVPLLDSIPEAGACTKLLNGEIDGCQLFMPSESNPRKCQACNCHRSFHKPPPILAGTFPSATVATSVMQPSTSVVKPSPSSCGDLVIIGDDETPESNNFVEPVSKKAKCDLGKVKLEFPDMEQTQQEDLTVISGGITQEIVDDLMKKYPGIIGVPRKLRVNWESLLQKYPETEFGKFYPRESKDVKTNTTWIIWCDPCQKEMRVNPGVSYNLSNFEIHLQPRKIIGRSGIGLASSQTKHELALAEQRKGIEYQEQITASLEATKLAKCEGWIKKHAAEGAEMIDDTTWRCTVCDYKGTFGQGDTVGVHMKGGPHNAAKKNKAATMTQTSQPSIAEALAKGVKSLTQYPLEYTPNLMDIPHSELLCYIEKNICHGFYETHIIVNKEKISVQSLKYDLHRGSNQSWYPDPHCSRTITIQGTIVNIIGTFRHVDCNRVFCSMCPLISGFSDFRKRALRARDASVPRGERTLQPGCRLDRLQLTELLYSARAWDTRAELFSDRIWLLNKTLTRVITAKSYLEKKLRSTMEEGSLPEIAELFRKAIDCDVFEKRHVLYNLLYDTVTNLLSLHRNGGDGRGKRYHSSTIKLFEVVQNFGGSSTHNFLSRNLIGPVLNTSSKLYRKEGFIYTLGLNAETFEHLARILTRCKKSLGICSPIPFECAEDETKCMELATLNRRDDVIDGFCGPKESDQNVHKCTFDPKPSAKTWESITSAFNNLYVGSMCRVLVANPLVQGMPRLVYGILTTCNKFDAVQVKEQWIRVAELHKQYLEHSIGPLRGHDSDGDARRRKLMLESIYRGTFGLSIDNFLMKVELVDGCPLIMMQDPIHVGKKLRNPLLSPRKSIFWGHYLAHKNHLQLVTDLFPREEHGLLDEDINVKDKQNFPAVQRIAFPCVRACLEKLNSGIVVNGIFRQECVLGTIIHLEVVWAFLEIFYGRGTLYKRVVLASFVTHMLYMGSEYILGQKHGHTISNNWLSRETRTDCLIACHGSVCYVMMMRDFYPHLPCPLSLVGSDCCEDFFSLLGQQVKNKHTFCVGEAIERCSHIGRTEQVKCDDDGISFTKSRRRKNIWWENNAHMATGDLQDYKSVSEQSLCKAWSEGLQMAHSKAKRVNIKSVLLISGKWLNPCPPSFSHESLVCPIDQPRLPCPVNIRASTVDPTVDNPESRIVHEAIVMLQSALLHDSQAVTTLLIESQNEHGEIMEGTKEQKHSSCVEVPGKGQVYKMRLILELNVHSVDKLPIDRLRRVRYRSSDPDAPVADADQLYVGLFDDVGLLIDEGQGNLNWFIGRIQKLVKSVGVKGAQVDYVRPVSLSEENISLLPKYYKHIAGAEYTYGGFEGEECDFVGLEVVICLVSIVIDVDKGVYTLAKEDCIALDKHLACERDRLGLTNSRRREKRSTVHIPSHDSITVRKRGRPPQHASPSIPMPTLLNLERPSTSLQISLVPIAPIVDASRSSIISLDNNVQNCETIVRRHSGRLRK